MKGFIRELRRREVFRTAGLYVGICWILIEAASIILPTFDAPEWTMRAVIILTVVGFPITVFLAWIYNLTDHGIEIQGDPTDTMVASIGTRKMDFAVIGILTLALLFSIYLNINSGPAVVEDPDPVSVLIADFDNNTDQELFDGLLEQALNIGIEVAPHVTAYQRTSARSLAEKLHPDSTKLDTTLASLIAVREGIKLVLAGSIEDSGSGYKLQVDGIEPTEGRVVFTISEKAGSADVVLTAIGEMSQGVREELGDTTLDSDSPIAETFTAASLEAARAYMNGLDLAYQGNHDEAVLMYREATEMDANFGRAFSGWALSEFKLGRVEEATELWNKSLSLMETMTERESLRTLGLYYASVTRNYGKAVESFSELVEKYPADAAGHNNLAVSYFLTLDFSGASEEGRRIMEIYPTSQLYRSNYTLYAMYSGEFAEATLEAQKMIEEDSQYGVPYLPLAIAAIDSGDANSAITAYENMAQATTGTYQASLAALGLADIAIYSGEFSTAREHLLPGIERDMAEEDSRGAAIKYLALAETYAAEGNIDSAAEAIGNGLNLSTGDSLRVAAAMLFLSMGDTNATSEIAAELSSQLQSHTRAYGQMLNGMVSSRAGRHVEAIDSMRSALDFADLWLIRFELGKAYLAAGFNAEALDEFRICAERRGAATALFLDDMPTYRVLATLPYWAARAQDSLGMQSAAAEGYARFIELRPQGGPLADDARQRLR